MDRGHTKMGGEVVDKSEGGETAAAKHKFVSVHDATLSGVATPIEHRIVHCFS